MAGVYALISPEGGLRFRDGVPGRMLEDTGAEHAAASTPAMLHGSWFTILRPSWSAQGLSGHADDSTAPSNLVGQRLLVALGSSDPAICGNLAICGTRVTQNGHDTVLCGLTEAQQRLIHDAHGRARYEEFDHR